MQRVHPHHVLQVRHHARGLLQRGFYARGGARDVVREAHGVLGVAGADLQTPERAGRRVRDARAHQLAPVTPALDVVVAAAAVHFAVAAAADAAVPSVVAISVVSSLLTLSFFRRPRLRPLGSKEREEGAPHARVGVDGQVVDVLLPRVRPHRSGTS
jgi:hypothetical protein